MGEPVGNNPNGAHEIARSDNAAAGDITGGIHGEHALMGDMLASAAVFGRIAARTLVKNGRAVKRQD